MLFCLWDYFDKYLDMCILFGGLLYQSDTWMHLVGMKSNSNRISCTTFFEILSSINLECGNSTSSIK